MITVNKKLCVAIWRHYRFSIEFFLWNIGHFFPYFIFSFFVFTSLFFFVIVLRFTFSILLKFLATIHFLISFNSIINCFWFSHFPLQFFLVISSYANLNLNSIRDRILDSWMALLFPFSLSFNDISSFCQYYFFQFHPLNNIHAMSNASTVFSNPFFYTIIVQFQNKILKKRLTHFHNLSYLSIAYVCT